MIIYLEKRNIIVDAYSIMQTEEGVNIYYGPGKEIIITQEQLSELKNVYRSKSTILSKNSNIEDLYNFITDIACATGKVVLNL